MIPITQTRTGHDGNCFAASIASILQVPLSEVDGLHENTINGYLRKKGLQYKQAPYRKGQKVSGWTTIEGKSPRGGMHACVAHNGRLVFDPHPQDGTGRGLVKVKNYGLIYPISGGKMARDRADYRLADLFKPGDQVWWDDEPAIVRSIEGDSAKIEWGRHFNHVAKVHVDDLTPRGQGRANDRSAGDFRARMHRALDRLLDWAQ